MAYFDATLEADPITEQQSTPVLPEERHVFELIGFERSEPDEYRKDGGIRWTWRVFAEDGRTPFVFQDEQYLFFRTTNIDRQTRKPLFTVGSSANDWASALLGRPLGPDAVVSIPDLHGKRFSAMVVWKRQKKDPTKYSIELASLRHVPAAPSLNGHAAPASVSADAAVEDVDRALSIAKFEKKLERAKKKKLPALATFVAAYETFSTATVAEVDQVTDSLDEALDAMD
jgi:hypothetical protein